VTVKITRPELQAFIFRRLESGSFKDAEDVIVQALELNEAESDRIDESRRNAIDRLKAFGKTHHLSLGGMTIRELREETRP
jgi:Arc/MetJ-type ribon-helix-helix transcriptional regulator